MMVYSPTGISDLFLIMGCMTSDFFTGAFPLCIPGYYRELIPSFLLN